MNKKIDKAALASRILSLEGISSEDKSALLELLSEQKRFGLVWEEKSEEAQDYLQNHLPILKEVDKLRLLCQEKKAPNHALIEGDNFHALVALEYALEGKLDVIYIDPPYNTGAKNWIYNNDYVDKEDSYRHSKWISMMNHRLKIARKLLKEDGALILAIDENELATIKLLLEEIFGYSYEIDCITIVQNPRGIQGKNFSYTNEFALFVIPKGIKTIGNRRIPDNEIDWRNLRDNGGESLRSDAKNCFYPIITDGVKIVGFGDVVYNENVHPKQTEIIDGKYYIYPIDISGTERKWRYARQSVEGIIGNLRVRMIKNHFEIEIGKNFGTYRTVWDDARYDANEYGKKVLNSIIPNCPFDFPKSIYNVYDCLYAVIAGKKEAKILDFFAGSGTTLHATMQLNAEDGGHRQCILVTNNENNICEEVTYERNKRVIQGYTTPKGQQVEGLKNNNLRYYKVDFIDREKTAANQKELMRASTDLLCIKENLYQEETCFEGLKLHPQIARYFTDGKEDGGQMLVIYEPNAIPAFVKRIEQMSVGKENKLKVYVMAEGQYPYTEDFESVLSKVELRAMPHALYQAMRQVLPPPAEAENTEPDMEVSDEEADGSIYKSEEQ